MRFKLLFVVGGVFIHSLIAAERADPPPPAITTFKPMSPLAVELTRARLVGWWYGDQPTKEGGRVQWIMRRAQDGTFTVTFRTTHVGEDMTEQTEAGEWGVSGNFLVTVTKKMIHDGVEEETQKSDAYFWDVYQVLKASADELVYRAVESGNEYHVKKVSEGFEFPKESQASAKASEAKP